MTASIEDRVAALERKRFHGKDPDESMRRARQSVEEKGAYSAAWKWVPDNYYTLTLEQRAACLGASSLQNLCKSLLMENRKVEAGSKVDPTNPRFVLVVIQYAAQLDVKKLANAIRSLRKDVNQRLDLNDFNFRIATEEDNRRISGYEHNSVTPFGFLEDVAIVVASPLRDLKFFWMGGGHVHLKLGMAFSEFCKATNPVVADISQPRTSFEDCEND